MKKFITGNYNDDIDSLADFETFNSKYVQICGNSTAEEDDDIINKFKYVKIKYLDQKSKREDYKIVEFINENKEFNSDKINCDPKKENIFVEFSIENYIKRIANRMLSKKGLRNVALNLVAKEEIDLENMILFRGLTSRANKKEYVDTLSKVIMNVIRKDKNLK